MSTVTVYWGDVVSLTSARNFEVEIASGQLYYGSLAPAEPRKIVVKGISTSRTLVLLDIVRISPLEASFWSRIDGNIDVGFSFAQASKETQWTLNSTAQYRRPRHATKASFSSTFTSLEGADSISRNHLLLSTQRKIGSRWLSAAFGQFQQDDSLGLNLRSAVGGAFGHYFLQRSQTNWSVFSGLSYTNEQFSGEAGETSGEVLLGSDWEWFTPRGNDTDLSTTVLTYYNVTGRARARLELSTAYKQKVITDLYWSINAFDSFDSSPPDQKPKNDFGVSVSLGWSF
jgi:hypothetical protein